MAEQVDVIEPIAKFTAALQGKSGVRDVFNCGLEDWQPTEGVQYDLVWTQWCVGHLTDEQLVAFLERCKTALTSDGVIVLKENLCTSGKDLFDDLDSSVTRYVYGDACRVETGNPFVTNMDLGRTPNSRASSGKLASGW